MLSIGESKAINWEQHHFFINHERFKITNGKITLMPKVGYKGNQRRIREPNLPFSPLNGSLFSLEKNFSFLAPFLNSLYNLS